MPHALGLRDKVRHFDSENEAGGTYLVYEIGIFTATAWNQHGLPSISRGVMHTQTFADQNRADARPTPTTRRNLAQFLGHRLPSDRQPNPNSWARTASYFL